MQGTCAFIPSVMTSHDGYSLNIYTMGAPSAPVVLIANAFGMPVDLVTPLATTLQSRFYVVTWESRGVPSADGEAETCDLGLASHIGDLFSVMDHVAADSAYVVGWCTGAKVSACAAACSDRIDGCVLLNGAFNLPNGIETPFEANMRNTMSKIGVSRRLAEGYFAVLQSYRSGSAGTEGLRRQDSLLIRSQDPELDRLIAVPLDTAESLYRYGRLIGAFMQEQSIDWIQGVRQKRTLIVTGGADQHAHPDGSEWVAGQLASAGFLRNEQWDHFALYRQPRLCDQVMDFLVSIEEERNGSQQSAKHASPSGAA